MNMSKIRKEFLEHIALPGGTLENFRDVKLIEDIFKDHPNIFSKDYPGGIEEVRNISKFKAREFWTNLYCCVLNNEKISNPPSIITLAISYLKGLQDESTKLIEQQFVYIPTHGPIEEGETILPETKI